MVARLTRLTRTGQWDRPKTSGKRPPGQPAARASACADAIMAGLLPIMWSTGTGSEIMQGIAVPMIGGLMSSTLLTLIVISAIFGLIKGFRLPNEDRFDVQSVPAKGPIELPSKVLEIVE